MEDEMTISEFARISMGVVISALLCSSAVCQKSPQASQESFQCFVVAPSYDYEISGRKDRVKGYVVRLDAPDQLGSPGLVLLVSGVDPGEGFATVNGHRYELPAQMGETGGALREKGKNQPGKEGWYSFTSGDDIVGKVVIPVKSGELKAGMNEIEFFRADGADGYDVIDARLESVSQATPTLIGQTYHILGRGRTATVRDFDFVFNYRSEKKRSLADIPDWARRGKVNFYRAGIDWKNLDRMFEMFKEAKINLVATNVPSDTSSDEYRRVKSFIDRCHANNIRVTAFNSLGGIGVRDLLMHPERRNWISRDDYDNLRWRAENNTFAADLQNPEYRANALNQASVAIDAGVDEMYYDWSIGGTGDVIHFLDDVRQLAKSKGRNVSIFGNCKGNVLVDEVADLIKTEGTSEAGVWNGKWVHNIAQARFYYASGYGSKSYESKYEGADPGVPNPGAHDIRDGMKVGWRKPIAEASAFQSHFAIAEAGPRLLQGWVMKDNPIAVQTWQEISRYFTFLSEHQDLYADVLTVSKIGIISPPHIPSFEVSLKRDNLYNALAESNVMYEVVLLHRLTTELLSPYKAIVIPNIPHVDTDQLGVLRRYKETGGKIYTIGSNREMRELADIQSPAAMLEELQNARGRKELLANINQLSGDQLITLPGSSYVATNVVKKTDTGRVILHFVNYNTPLKNVRVHVNLEGVVDQVDLKSLQLLSPDGGARQPSAPTVRGTQLEFVLPELDVYDVVTIN
jgi:hypothetical protein